MTFILRPKITFVADLSQKEPKVEKTQDLAKIPKAFLNKKIGLRTYAAGILPHNRNA